MATPITAQTNLPYPNRIAINLGSYVGPFQQNGPLGAFNPIRDLQVYVDGALIPVQTWAFDSINNRYLLYMNQAFNLQGVIQIVHHVPDPPFFSIVPAGNPLILYLSLGESPGEDSGG